MPQSLVLDNEIQFSGYKLKEWYQGLDIKQFFTFIANPQANGKIESSPGESAFNLVYGSKVIAPVEINKPSWRGKLYDRGLNVEQMKADLDFVDKIYKTRMTRAYNLKFRARNFQVGNLVLRKAEKYGPIYKPNPNWKCPYKVAELVSAGAYKLQYQDG
ncbi:hypothetical protein CDL12_15279 [Handroanthus impetiginosus]|uniref:Integrase catalytic domain-containing protein n=1 Tax=Handroanthus impetiginosus TaxID=429701 RepID=A0A2G9H3N6_9LAMI|nr:hypothetical protein CDL12_15279 [Handroanthus impetiginosus]